jgi:outer membrane protein assembly factor BamB
VPSIRRAGVALLLAAGLLGAACSDGGDDSGSPPAHDDDRPAVEVPPQVARSRGEWPVPGGDYANSRAQVDATITSDDIDDLDVAWSVPLEGAGVFGNASTTPVIVDGVVYVQDLQSDVTAVDLDTGAVRWSHEYGLPQVGPNGVAVGYGKVFVTKGMDGIAALDLRTGDELWDTTITATETDGVDIQPLVVDGLVLAATVPVSFAGQFRGGDRGVLWALDADTGERVWTFDTVPKDLWGDPAVNSGGGAWYPPAVDVDRGLVYWGTANPAPFPGQPSTPNGSSRPGPNPYTDSIVALDVRTGRLVWQHQVSPHDLFDHDLQLTAIVPRDEGDPLVVGTGKAGRVVAVDAGTGEVVSDTPVGVHENDDLDELTGPTEVLPGLFGGVLTPPAVADGVLFAPTVNAPSLHEPGKENFFGGAPLGTMHGQLVAVDVARGEVVWDTEVPGDPLGGALVVGDLVLTATMQGDILAVDRATGEVVRTIRAPGGVNGWPAATRDTIVWPVAMAQPAALVAYRVGG